MIVYPVYLDTFIIPIHAVLIVLMNTSPIRKQIVVINVLKIVWLVQQVVVNSADQDILKKH